jgi:hypothetical protein
MKYLIIILLLITSCEHSQDTSKFFIDGVNYRVVIIDSCQYIRSYNELAHKGNCFYCEERKSEQIRN